MFGQLAPELFETDYVSAELVKLFNNISRYVHFAMANQFALIADTFDANIYEIRRMANHNYPRSHLAMPGFTAGTCLRKDLLNLYNFLENKWCQSSEAPQTLRLLMPLNLLLETLLPLSRE